MGIFDNLFGGNKKKSEQPKPELRLEYNIMNNITLETCDKYSNQENYKLIENGIYKDLKDEDDANYRMTISYELDSDNSQYPLEDILDKFYLHVSDFLESENDSDSNKVKQELGGTLDGIKNAQEIIGKKIYNQDFLDEDGQIRVNLKIE
ncbi:hypothetical protein GCM10011344_07780 [Dokdonia pacifica]|uniref:Uncharacterized protein n=1 Tax=Dokdonia pacifica TaxID=1627892 RepID=A0A238YXY0_9FLAO|nr:hypothetical protein [Dokdonia pacifica]GGG09622.1 hypothetical protein GCM10011344_07780 [Dokdonia pacifica]SNR75568.1 hypothetical protein SAMN06265376_102423 [Dokdonia pacifica]